jgi:hypothetical protein
VSVAKGNLIQLAGLALGASLLYLAAHLQAAGAVRVALMLVGSVIIYDYCHAVFHWAVGRLLSIRFRSYGARGTDHSETYPLGIRQLMSVMPFFTTITQRESMREASPTAKALMFAAGETGTTVVSLVAAFYAWQSGIPGGGLLFWVMVGWTVAATIATPPRRRGTMLRRSRTVDRLSTLAADRQNQGRECSRPLCDRVRGETFWKVSSTYQPPHHQPNHGCIYERLCAGAQPSRE